MIAGKGMAGSNFRGRIRGMKAAPVGYGGAAVSFRHEGIVPAQSFRYAVAFDGELHSELGPGETSFELLLPDDEEHTADVRIIPSGTRSILDLHGTRYGRRAWLTWARRSEADLAGYRIFMDSGETAANAGDPTDSIVSPVVAARPHSGTGTGRISARGDWDGGNRTVAIAIESAGHFTHDASGEESDPIPFEAGTAAYLPHGLLLEFHDSADAYDVGDAWTINCGPKTSWLSGPLAEGTHEFEVCAVDSSGNVGTASATFTVATIHAPDGLESFAAAYSVAQDEIALTWTAPDEDCDVYIYCNFSKLFGTLLEHVDEDSVWAVVDGSLAEFAFAPQVAGLYKFKAVRRDADGRFSNLALWAEVSTLHPSEDDLPSPDTLAATPEGSGMVSLQFLYRPSETQIATVIAGGELDLEFRVYDGGSLIESGPMDFEETEGGVIVVTASLGPLSAGLHNLTVRAYDGDLGMESPDSAVLAVAVDTTAPGQVSGLGGVKQ